MLAVACSPSLTEPTTSTSGGGCVDLSGTYDVTYTSTSCPTNIYLAMWQLNQSGCAFRTPPFPDVPSVSGTVNGSAVMLSLRNGFTACIYQLDGSGQFDGKTLRATVAGDVSGPCCSGTSESLHIVAVRR